VSEIRMSGVSTDSHRNFEDYALRVRSQMSAAADACRNLTVARRVIIFDCAIGTEIRSCLRGEHRSMNRVMIFVFLACTAALTCVGADYHYICNTPGCSFGRPLIDTDPRVRPPLQIGYYDLVGHISGYCFGCDKFVTIRWKSTAVPPDVSTNLPYSSPQKLASIWVPCVTKILNLLLSQRYRLHFRPKRRKPRGWHPG
jgi:hypothetical protein